MSVSCALSALLIAGSVCLAGPPDLTLPDLPDPAGDVAEDVLDQLGAGIVPPVPNVVTPPEPGPGAVFPPELPDAAGDVAKDVLDQIAAGTLPPVPDVPELGPAAGAGSMTPVPEPGALALLALGGLALIRRRRR